LPQQGIIMSTLANSTWMIYGAYGYTGRLIVEESVRRGYKPILAGRNANKLAELAQRHGLEWQVMSLADASRTQQAVRGKNLLLNAAGPFSETGPPLIAACLDAGVSYIDVSGELEHLRNVEAQDGMARKDGLALLTSAGFGTTYADILASCLLERLPTAIQLRLSVAAANALRTPGAQRTVVAVLADGGYVVTGGRFARRRLADQTWTVRTNGAAVDFAAAPMGELASLRHSTRIGEIVVGRPMPRGSAMVLRTLSPLLKGALAVSAIRRYASRDGAGAAAPTPVQHDGLRSQLWAEARDANGTTVVAQLDTGEGYVAAAEAAIANAEALVEGDLRGAFTPGSAFGAALLARLPNVTISQLC